MITPEMIKAAEAAGRRQTACLKCGQKMPGAQMFAHMAEAHGE